MDDARYQMEVNIFGAIDFAKNAENRYGKIVNISSVGGKIVFPLGGWYHASKFALEALSDSMRNEVREFGIDNKGKALPVLTNQKTSAYLIKLQI